jgi:hypothetical protein
MSDLRRFKNFKNKPVTVHCPETDRVCTFKPKEERAMHVTWEDALLSKGLVPLDEIERVEEGETNLAEQEAAAAEAQRAADAAAEAERAEKLKAAQEEAEIQARRSAAAKKGAATKRANAAKS